MTPFLLVFFLLVGPMPGGHVQPVVVGMYPSAKTCAEAAVAKIELAEAQGIPGERLYGACISSGHDLPAV